MNNEYKPSSKDLDDAFNVIMTEQTMEPLADQKCIIANRQLDFCHHCGKPREMVFSDLYGWITECPNCGSGQEDQLNIMYDPVLAGAFF